MIAIAQVSDIHLDGSPERADRARAVMDRLRGGRRPRPVAYHILGDDGRLTTHYRPVDLAARG